jgi:superfamily II DNA or RNA helicase
MLEQLDLTDDFTEATLSKGELIRRGGKIKSFLTPDADTVLGKVRGSNGETYEQMILLVHEDGTMYIDGHCSCPVGFNCKHVAALVLELTARAAQGAPARPEKAATPLRREVVLPQTLESWLDRARHISDAPSYGTNHRLLYVLSVGYNDKADRWSASVGRYLQLDLYSARLKNGTYHDIKQAGTPHRTSSVPQYVALELDLLRFIDACASRRYYPGVTGQVLDDSDLTQHLLQRLLATGRLFWQDASTEPLRAGDVRPARAAWRMLPDGTQETTLEAAPEAAHVLPIVPAWYVDTDTRELGRLEPDLPAAQLKVFLNCPPVMPEAAPAFRERFEEALGGTLPAPHRFETKDRKHACVPRLTLFSLTGLTPFGSSADITDTAALEYVYGDVVIPASDAGSVLSRYQDGVLERIPRDAKTESKAQKRLLAENFLPAGRILSYLREDKWHHFMLLTDRHANEAHWLAFVQEVVPRLRRSGWEVHFDPSFRYQVLQPEAWYGEVDESSGQDWFGLELGVVVDGERVSIIPLLVSLLQRMPHALSPEALAELPDDGELLVPFEGKKLALPVARVRAILTVLIELYLKEGADGPLRLPLLDAARLLELEEALEVRWAGGEKLREMGQRLRNFSSIRPVAPPKGLRAQLRPYQQEGLAWLQFLREYNLSGILADDMGLGKTLQTLAHLLMEKEAGRAKRPSLVVAPTSLMHTWRSEAKRFTPDLKVLVLHGKDRQALFDRIPEHDLILTTYPLVPRDVDTLQEHAFHLLVLDEAQNIKNVRTAAFKTVASLVANHRVCLSGTPLENHLGELWSLFHFLMPGFLGSSEVFRRLYRTPIEKGGDTTRQAQLARRVKPFILRRTKAEVARELPEKTESVITVELEGAQRDLYETLRSSMHERIRKEIDTKGLARSHITILDALLKLRQACCDPRLLSLSAAKRVKSSAKLEWLEGTLPNLLEEGRKVLLFSQFATLLGLIEESLQRMGVPYAKLTGQTRNREAQVRAFQEGDARVFLITLKAGGVGLNLTAADTVIHFDPWWNPAAENQATDRAYRIGQDKPVFVYKLIAESSIEEKILVMQEHKAALARGILDGSLDKSSGLTPEDLNLLFEPLA